MMETEYVSSCIVCDSKLSDLVETTPTMMGNDERDWDFRKCSDCEMVFLSPRVNEENLDMYYTDSYLPYRGADAWGKYSKLVASDQRKIDKLRLRTVLKYTSKQSKTILDIGCGKPSFLKLTQEKTGLHSVGIDFSDKGWKGSRDLYSKLDLHVGAANELPNDIHADVITMWHYLEHDYSPRKTLQALSAHHRKGTLLIIEVPNHDSYTRKKYGKYWSGYHAPRHTGLYTPKTMKNLLEHSGWNVEDQYTYGTLDPYTLDWMSRMEQQEIDWAKSMESHFINYVFGKMIRPRYFFHKFGSLGFMTIIARKIK